MENPFENLTKEEMLEVLGDFAANWLAHDGTWFLAAEKKYGMDAAVALDAEAWRNYAPIEARRIMKRFGIQPGGGLPALKKALSGRMYALLNKQDFVEETENSFVFRMVECRVQAARKRKNLPLFPCSGVGIVEYSEFARAVDARIKTGCVACPPEDDPEGFNCAWRFSIEKG